MTVRYRFLIRRSGNILLVSLPCLIAGYYEVGRCGNNCAKPPYGEWLTYFTNWSLMLLGSAGLVAFVNTARHYYRERRGHKLHKRFLAGSSAVAGSDASGDNGVNNGTAAAPAGVEGDMERGNAGVASSPDKNPLTAAREVGESIASSALRRQAGPANKHPLNKYTTMKELRKHTMSLAMMCILL